MWPTMTRKRKPLQTEWKKDLHEDIVFKLKSDGLKKKKKAKHVRSWGEVFSAEEMENAKAMDLE